MPKYYFIKFNELWRSSGLFTSNPGTLSKFRQYISRALQGGVVLTLLATNSAVANQDGNNLPYRECFESTAKTYNLDSDWLTAIAIVESSLNPKAVSSANALGLMQIKWPQTAAHLGIRTRTALFDPCTNVDAGGRYLRELTDRYKGNKQTALAAYRIGPSALARAPTEPAVVLEYRRRINEQLDILRPAISSSYSNASATGPAPPPLAKKAPVTAPNPKPVAGTTKTTEVAPKEYVAKVFDEYAPRFERHLTIDLQYNTPTKLRNMFDNFAEIFPDKAKNAVDLGCGTGLCGIAFNGVYEKICGIDLSSKMLEEAKKKNIYDKLILGDLIDSLDTHAYKFDLFISADTFIYLGNLSRVFESAAKRAAPNAGFIFTTESCETEPYILGKSGRYSHSFPYIESVCKKNGFMILKYLQDTLRKEPEGWVLGGFYLAKRV